MTRWMMTYGAMGDDVSNDRNGATGDDDDVDGNGVTGNYVDNDGGGEMAWLERKRANGHAESPG